MKLSEAIEALQSSIASHGDIELKMYDEFGRLVSPKSVKPIESKGKPEAARFAAK